MKKIIQLIVICFIIIFVGCKQEHYTKIIYDTYPDIKQFISTSDDSVIIVTTTNELHYIETRKYNTKYYIYKDIKIPIICNQIENTKTIIDINNDKEIQNE